ncbi:ROK family transcriptional regulator [Tindallia californiensis]|uniref:Sugar kinase of the NBD/HSP70 family, may contain an N-terminal HTH domain n=1 Tax=Tindallia californiensis TaxID=159292 RepID=A0A1H3PAF5_9FIRM|nr:ROK family transcriptional regulator [Tindallia californiensis]SDY98077.1 Sugar kinase of the NBD/HSP70 family, may contain an N-terminal HTH domain [Tindallia californiensis]
MRRLSNNIDVKRRNRNQIFRYVNKHQRISKPEISHALHLSIPTVLHMINELLAMGLVKKDGELQSTGGRKAVAISPVHDKKSSIGIDITRNHIGLVHTDLSGQVLKYTRLSKPYKNDSAYYKALGAMAMDFKKENIKEEDAFLGYGISVPGIVEPEMERIKHSHALGITNVAFHVFTQYISGDTIFINDANAAAIAEIYNDDQPYDALYLSLSNSVGGAIIKNSDARSNEDNQIHDRLYLGDNWRGGEVGHTTLVPGGEKCYCGKNGCFDVYCSAEKLANLTEGKLGIFFEELEKGNKNFQKMWEEYLEYLAIQVNNLRMIFDCKIIIGGYVGSFIDPSIEKLREKAAKRNTFEKDASYIVPCRYRYETSALGAALQHIEKYISSV